ncbi:hypothetical protein ABT369_32470 [Dactylosporangium sp. NPDC000244]|uniref:hypothetical protein n=1 Tax=Dactylosporangium sp. NPDC000244 TaxID=3154365 RepID=UPI003318C8E5
MPASLSVVVHARGLAALADGRPADAYDALARLYDLLRGEQVLHPGARLWLRSPDAASSARARSLQGPMPSCTRSHRNREPWEGCEP